MSNRNIDYSNTIIYKITCRDKAVTDIYIKHRHKLGFVTKDEYAQTLRAYQKSQNETKSDARDKVLAARNAGMIG